jgi:phosphoribosylformylglycinamidine synthase
MAISGIIRIEEFHASADTEDFDPNAFAKIFRVKSNYFTIDIAPEAILDIDDIAAYNKKKDYLSPDEVEYLDNLAVKIGRKLTDSEILVSRKPIQSTRHKIFNGKFVIDGVEKNLLYLK